MVYFATYSVIFRSMLGWLIAEKDLRLAGGGGRGNKPYMVLYQGAAAKIYTVRIPNKVKEARS
jgi:hypothetical protein